MQVNASARRTRANQLHGETCHFVAFQPMTSYLVWLRDSITNSQATEAVWGRGGAKLENTNYVRRIRCSFASVGRLFKWGLSRPDFPSQPWIKSKFWCLKFLLGGAGAPQAPACQFGRFRLTEISLCLTLFTLSKNSYCFVDCKQWKWGK